MATFYLKTIINAPIERCFDLARSVELHKVSTAQTNEEAIAGVTNGLLTYKDKVQWRAKHFGIYQKLSVQITAFDKPYYFKDEMIKGIFNLLKHEHLFESINNATLMTDKFHFKAPLGILGTIAEGLFLKTYMKRFLIKRNNTIKAFAESEQWKLVLSS